MASEPPASPRGDRRPHIVIVGAGFGGLAVVHGLRAAAVDITLVDRQNHHVFQPLLYQVATAGLSPADIAGPIRSIVKHQHNVLVLLDEVIGVEPDAKTVRLKSGDFLRYDTLVLATGARHSYFGSDHWAQFAPGIKTIDDATRVRRTILLALEAAETKRAKTDAAQVERVTFVVIGGGPTGVEMAGAVAELTRHAAAMEFVYLTPDCVRILLIEAGDRVLAGFPPDLSRAAALALADLGVEVRLGARVTGIDANGVSLGDEAIPAAAVIWAAGVQASPAGAWIGAPTDRAGRLQVAGDLTAPGRPDIFVIGDTVTLTGAKGRPIPGIAPAAKQEGAYVAKAIAARLRGRRRRRPFAYRDYGTLATIGRRRAVIDFGWLHLSGLAAWLIWSTAHVYFLVGFRNRLLVGMTWLWNYVTFERGARLITGLGDASPAEHTAPPPP